MKTKELLKTIYVEERLHRAMRLMSVECRMNLQEIAEEAIERWLVSKRCEMEELKLPAMRLENDARPGIETSVEEAKLQKRANDGSGAV